MAVKVQFEIGHTSKLRSKRTVEGFTHDWELYVKGVQQADISVFVEKIIFHLHESFQNHNRVFKEPPYIVQESGYAGFIVFIDIYFRNRDEPKKVQFSYDLDLQNTGPPRHRCEIKTFIFDNPSEEYRQKLLKGGGVPVSGVVGGGPAPTINNNSGSMPVGASLNHSSSDGHKNIIGEGKKHKSRPDDLRSNSFANLFGPPITKITPGVTTAHTKNSPDNKVSTPSTNHQSSSGSSIPVVKEKSSKDRDKLSEKSKDRSTKKEKHYKQSPHKEARSESKKSDSSKHDKRDKTDEKSKKDKNRDKDKDREKNKPSSASVNNTSNNNKKSSSPKPAREHSPHKTSSANNLANTASASNTNSIPRPSSSNSGKIEDLKSSKSSKESTGESKSKDSKQKESSSSSSSSRKSKKEKKDREKDRDKEKRHEEKEKQKSNEGQQRSAGKEESKVISPPTVNSSNGSSSDQKNSKSSVNSFTTGVTHINEGVKKPEKVSKQDLFKTTEKSAVSNPQTTSGAATVNNTSHSSNDKKSSGSLLNTNSNPPEKDKRSHKHKKKEKNKDKDKDRERDKEREKDKDKERDKDKDKEREKEVKKEKEIKEKHHVEKSVDALHSTQNPNVAKVILASPINTTEALINNTTSLMNSSSSLTAPLVPNSASTSTSATTSSTSSSTLTKSSKNKEKKSKDKTSSKEEKLKHKLNDVESSEIKSKQPKLTNSNSLSASSSSSSVSSSIANPSATSVTNSSAALHPVSNISAVTTTETTLNLDLSDTDSLPPTSTEGVKKPTLQPPPIAHSDSSNSSFPDLPLPKQQPAPKDFVKSISTPVAVVTPLNNATMKEPLKNNKPSKDKLQDKLSKEEEKEKKRRRNSVAVNTFIEPPLKQLKKEQIKSVREKSKSPSLRNTGSRASISAEASTTFLQPSASPSSTAAAAPLPPPSSTPSTAHSPALSATEAVGNAASATANAATCNSNSTPSSTTNTSILAPHQLSLDYLSELQELHHKIMTLQDNDDLQHVVELIAATGCYEITTKTFDFDLCKLDRGTVQRLQEFFATSVS